ncbi:DUF3795 domain-containing protein [Chloroflexota bacterium]
MLLYHGLPNQTANTYLKFAAEVQFSTVNINHPTVGICGLSCILCPSYQTDAISRCMGCKTESRMIVGCPFITCAVKKKGVEFCWNCDEHRTCGKWQKHREHGKTKDSFKCYQTLEHDIKLILEQGACIFVQDQLVREHILKQMLEQFNEGRSKSYYCIAVTVMDKNESEQALEEVKQKSEGLDIKTKAELLHSILDDMAQEKGYLLKLRK